MWVLNAMNVPSAGSVSQGQGVTVAVLEWEAVSTQALARCAGVLLASPCSSLGTTRPHRDSITPQEVAHSSLRSHGLDQSHPSELLVVLVLFLQLHLVHQRRP